jgi:hypothetical protein
MKEDSKSIDASLKITNLRKLKNFYHHTLQNISPLKYILNVLICYVRSTTVNIPYSCYAEPISSLALVFLFNLTPTAFSCF